ncbi:MAG: hypothetical protein WBC85_14360 [Planktotalea sp.]|uniref:hypothetical protein n=1 Tax=Planktotalea sp. TaxID=2029877 RepID=UPI003C7333A5
MSHKWAQLAKLATLAFDREVSKLSELKEAESKLASQREKLEGMNAQALEDFAGPHPAHWTNGDFLWQAWVAQNAKAIGIEQARLRVLAEMHKPELKKAFGRKTVMENLARRKTQ